jgi:D-alanyl-D-alanine carboxypeptidase/D-alanyl-D-alanine-endopeptidase (penicillin-binding protein 4)
VRAKTGSLAGIRALSGYLTTRSGERVAFSILVNSFLVPPAEIDRVIEEALSRVVTDG